MTVEEKLLPASYKGIPFLVLSSSVSGGRKTVKHLFPDSDVQTIEDLGLEPRIYSLNIIITGDDEYYQLRNQFQRVLESIDPGKLTHPLYGDIENVKARTYTVIEGLDRIGEARFNVVFEVTQGTGIPEQTENTLSLIQSAASTVRVAAGVNLANNYEVSNNFPNSYLDAILKLDNLTFAFSDNVAFSRTDTELIDAYNRAIIVFGNSTVSLVQQPQQLSDSVLSLLSDVNGLFPALDDAVKNIENFYTFGDDDITLDPTTASRQERNRNRALLNDTVQAVALSYSFENSAAIEFTTVDDIEERADALEEQYKKLIVSDGLDEDSKSSITDLRVEAQQFFETQKLVAQQIIEIETLPTSARLLSYRYYGSSELGQNIVDLNEIREPSFVEGTVRILSE